MTLIIYDKSGKIWNQMSGNYEVPNGLPYLEEEIPEGKYPERVDVSGDDPAVVYADYPKSEAAVLTEEVNALKTDNLLALQAVTELYEMLLSMGGEI